MLIFTRTLAFILFVCLFVAVYKSWSGNKIYYFLWLFGFIILSAPGLLPIYQNRRHEAAIDGDVATIRKYLDKGVDINIRDSQGLTFLHQASTYKHINLVNFLIQNGADVNIQDSDGVSSLHINNDVEIARVLIDSGAKINLKDIQGNTPLHWATGYGYKNIVSLLIQDGAEVNSRARNGKTTLKVALEKGYEDIAQILRNHSAIE